MIIHQYKRKRLGAVFESYGAFVRWRKQYAGSWGYHRLPQVEYLRFANEPLTANHWPQMYQSVGLQGPRDLPAFLTAHPQGQLFNNMEVPSWGCSAGYGSLPFGIETPNGRVLP